jgi:hypothetical protein
MQNRLQIIGAVTANDVACIKSNFQFVFLLQKGNGSNSWFIHADESFTFSPKNSY